VQDACGNRSNSFSCIITLQKSSNMEKESTEATPMPIADDDKQATIESSNIPTEHGDFKCYPNPFSEDLNIQYNLNQDIEQVTIKIYDLQGRLVKILPLGKQEAGFYQIRHNLVDLQTGTYHKCLALNEVCSKVKRVILMR
jgi:flagellar hook assembly protein FlgD